MPKNFVCRYLCLVSILLFFVASEGAAQEKPPQDAPLFTSEKNLPDDFARILEKTKAKNTDELIGLVKKTWTDGTLVPSQKARILETSAKLLQKGYETIPYIRDYHACVGYGLSEKKFPDGEFDKFLELINQMLDEQSPQKLNMNRLLRTTRAFMQEGLLYKSKGYKLRAKNAKISFTHQQDQSQMPAAAIDTTASQEKEEEGEDWFGTADTNTDTETSENTEDDSEWGDGWGDEETTEENKEETTETTDDWGDGNDDWGDENDDWGNSDWENENDYQNWGEGWENVDESTTEVEEVTIDSLTIPEQGTAACVPTIKLPKKAGYFLEVVEADLVFETRFDTVEINGFNGTLLPKTQKLIGKGGQFAWRTPGTNPDSTFCKLSDFVLDLKNPRFRAEYVRMHYPSRFDSTITGVLVWDNHRFNRHPQKAVFPKFQSYSNNIEVKNFAENVKYRGGFSMIGNRMSSEACNNGPSTIELIEEGQTKFKAISGSGFTFRDNKIICPKTKVWIYHSVGTDSTVYHIYHASVGLKYHLTPKKTLRLKKNKEGYRNFPFESSYHGVEITADYLEWDMESDSISFSILQSKDIIPLVVESKQYFDPYRYAGVQGGLSFHPLKLLIGYARHRFKNTKGKRVKGVIPLADLAKFAGKKPAVIRGAMAHLASLNFIDFYQTDPSDPNSVYISLKPKAIHYVRAHENMTEAMLARKYPDQRRPFTRNKHDYDTYNIRSRNPGRTGVNAVISLKDTARLSIRGVKNFVISDTAKVIAKPQDGIVAMGGNRRTGFNGTVQIDTMIFEGKGMQLDYRNFILNMDSVSSIRFMVLDSATGKRVPTPNGIQNTSGAFHIADRNNKSGMVKEVIDTRDYRDPEGSGKRTGKFIAKGEGFVYFDGEEIRGHESYKKDMVFFKLDSGFELSRVMPGYFESGIFPKFRESLSPMPDGSLGFRHLIEEKAEAKYQQQGYPLYDFSDKQPNRFLGTINLNNQGLMGRGTLKYLAGTFESPHFVFYPDSVISDTQTTPWDTRSGQISAGKYAHTGASYPAVSMQNFRLRWLVPQDSLLLISKPKNAKKNQAAEPFSIYTDYPEAEKMFEGTLVLTPKTLVGNGKIAQKQYSNVSEKFDFNAQDYTSRNSQFIIKSDDPQKPSVAANQVKVHYNLAQSLAKFNSETPDNQAFNFPYIAYQTNIGEAVWRFGKTGNKFVMNAESNARAASFISRKKGQEGLQFDGKRAIYDLDEDTLTVRGVENIAVANAAIIPDENKLTIRKNAVIDSLTNATIILNRFSKYHKITDAGVKIFSASRFHAKGNYTYTNDGGEEYILNLQIDDRSIVNTEKQAKKTKRRKTKKTPDEAIAGEGGFRITARGNIADGKAFIIQPGIQYGGNVEVQDHIPYPLFKGNAKLAVNREDNSWFKFENNDTTEVKIYVDGLEDGFSNAKIQTGLYLSQFKQIYPAFVQYKRKWAGGQALFKGTGELRYDANRQAYEVASTEKLEGNTLKGNRIFYSFEKDSVGFEGEFEFLEPAEDYSLRIGGSGGTKLDNKDYTFSTAVVLKIPTGSAIEKIMTKDLEIEAYREEVRFPKKEKMRQRLSPFLSEKSLQKIEDNTRVFDHLKGDIVFSDVTFKWSPKYKAFYSTGIALGLSSVFKEEIESYVKGAIEIMMGGTQRKVHIVLENRKGAKYYFGLQKNGIKTFSSNSEYMAAVKKEKKLKEAGNAEREILDFFSRVRIYSQGLNDLQIPEKPQEEDTNLGDKMIEDGP